MRRDDTKRRIMDAALELFAAHGYDAVSVEQIAGAVGIKAPSLYNHFVSKRAIFDEIVSDAAARYEDFTAMQSVHVDDADADTGEFLGISEDVLCQKVREIFLYSLHDKTVSRLRKLLTIEQFRSAELSKMYNERYVDRLANYHAGLFAHLMEKGQIKQYDPYVLVLMYVSPIMTLTGVCDRQPEREEECLRSLISMCAFSLMRSINNPFIFAKVKPVGCCPRGLFIMRFLRFFYCNAVYNGLLRGGNRAVIVGRLSRFANAVHNVHAVRNVAEHGVLPVKRRIILMHYEKLGACAVECCRACHTYRPARMRKRIVNAVCAEFALNILPAAACAIAVGVAALHHKAAYYAMKSKAVIEAFVCQLYKISNRYRRVVAVQCNGYNAVVGNVYFRIMRYLPLFALCRGFGALCGFCGRLCRRFGGGCGFVGGKPAGAQHQRAHKHSHHEHNMLSYLHSVTSIKNTG